VAPFAERTLAQKRASYAAFRGDDPEFKQRHGRLLKLARREPKPVATLVMEELETPRESHVLIQGDFTRPGDVVTPGVPEVLHDLGEEGVDRPRPNRLDLARWITATNNPLTARVVVNRVWQQYFGRGLVETENDFGTQGTQPTHPRLLDWLAWEFMAPAIHSGSSPRDRRPASGGSTGESGAAQGPVPWSLKHVHRLIVHSATYRQSSKSRPELASIDPNNRLLARQSRLRLDAEVIRDVALCASGLLSAKLGGPPVFPPQPDGVMGLGQVQRAWKTSTGENRYRRGIYTHIWRATPYPALAVFDAPDGFSSCTRRLRSNTPLQALTILNDAAFHEFAEAFGRRVMDEGGRRDSERLDFAFRCCLSRFPSRFERSRLLTLLREERTASSEATAWTTLCRVLLNLDETLTRE
jgi:hypothetical protein